MVSCLNQRLLRLDVCTDKLVEGNPTLFEVDRGDGEKLKVLYGEKEDTFFQLQESVHETSMFINDQIRQGKRLRKNAKFRLGRNLQIFTQDELTQCCCLETQVFMVTEYDPVFFLMPALLNSASVGISSCSPAKKNTNKSGVF